MYELVRGLYPILPQHYRQWRSRKPTPFGAYSPEAPFESADKGIRLDGAEGMNMLANAAQVLDSFRSMLR